MTGINRTITKHEIPDVYVEWVRGYLQKNVRPEINHKALEYTNLFLNRVVDELNQWRMQIANTLIFKEQFSIEIIGKSICLEEELIILMQNIFKGMFQVEVTPLTKECTDGSTRKHSYLPDILPNVKGRYGYQFHVIWTPENTSIYSSPSKRYQKSPSMSLESDLYASKEERGDLFFQNEEGVTIRCHSDVLGLMCPQFLQLKSSEESRSPIPFQCSPDILENIVYFAYHRNLPDKVNDNIEALINLYIESKSFSSENPIIQNLFKNTYDLIMDYMSRSILDEKAILQILILAKLYNEQELILPCLKAAEIIESSTPMDWSDFVPLYPKFFELALRNQLPKLSQRFQHLLETVVFASSSSYASSSSSSYSSASSPSHS